MPFVQVRLQPSTSRKIASSKLLPAGHWLSAIFSQYVVSVAKTEHEANGTSAQPVQTVTVEADYVTDSTPVYLQTLQKRRRDAFWEPNGSKIKTLLLCRHLALAIGQGLTDKLASTQDRLYYP